MNVRAIIVDDEPLARDRLRAMLQQEPKVTIVAECSDGHAALAAIRTCVPDLVFLDVQMPELDGFGVLSQLEGESMPAIVFVTAHDRFALRAFEIHAVDYLLKPFDQERFQLALQRALDRIQRRQGLDLREKLSALLADLRPATPSSGDRLAVKSSGRIVLISVSEIDWIEAADNYVNLHVGKAQHLHRETLSRMEERLGPNKFVRISRSVLVNIDRVRELQPLFHGDYTLLLRDGTRLTLSRSHRDKLDRLLGPAA